MKMTLPALLAAIAVASLPLAGAAPWKNIYTSGHADLGVAYEEDEGGLHFHYHFRSGAVINGVPLVGDEEVDIGDATTFVSSDAKISGVNIPAYNSLFGLGGSGGDLWVLPQVQNPALPFLGLATEDLDASDWAGGITFTLNSVSGPGEFSMWQSGAFSSLNFYFSRNNPAGTVNGSNTLTLPIGTHAHYNWGFTAPGLYEVTITVSGTHNDFGFLSDTQTIVFGVETIPAVPEPATYGLAIGVLLLGVVITRRRKGAAGVA